MQAVGFIQFKRLPTSFYFAKVTRDVDWRTTEWKTQNRMTTSTLFLFRTRTKCCDRGGHAAGLIGLLMCVGSSGLVEPRRRLGASQSFLGLAGACDMAGSVD